MSGVKALVRLLAFLVVPSVVGLLAFRHASLALQTGEGSALEALLIAPRCDRLPVDSRDPAWAGVRPQSVRLTPSTQATQAGGGAGVDAVEVRALICEGEVAFLLCWQDDTQNRESWWSRWGTERGMPPAVPDPPRDPGWYRWGTDLVAIQFPLEVRKDGALPSVVLGDPAHPVRLWMWDAETGVKELVVTGPASFRASRPVATRRVRGEAVWMDDRWTVVLLGRLDVPVTAQEAPPFAVYVWNGENGDAGLKVNHSRWLGLTAEDPLPLSALARGVSAGLGVLLLEWALLVWLRRPRC